MDARAPLVGVVSCLAAVLGLGGCGNVSNVPPPVDTQQMTTTDYVIGAGDVLQIFVWHNSDLSVTVRVRPDGRISVPLIDDLAVNGKTPTVVAREIEDNLANFVKDARVTVIMTEFIGPYDRQIRVVGEAGKPQAVPYRKGITVLDVLIQAGGLTAYAAGNRAVIVREADGKPMSYRVRLDDLIKDGDVSANVEMAPGDILLIPQSWF